MNSRAWLNSLTLPAYRAAHRLRQRLPSRPSKSIGTSGGGGVDRIYVINLDREDARWRGVQRELARLRTSDRGTAIDYTTRFSAIDARYPLDASTEIERRYTLRDQLHVDPHVVANGAGDIPIEMSDPEVAIAISHINVWRRCAEGEHEYSLVLEDDVYFPQRFSKGFDAAWVDFEQHRGSGDFDLLYVSYEEARLGAEWQDVSRHLRRPVRGLWQLSGYVLSRHGAQRLLAQLPVRGPVDLWLNQIFPQISVVATRRPLIKQRRDVGSSNFYSVLPVLAKVGAITRERPPTIDSTSLPRPVFAFGEAGSGLSALAEALSMLGYRCVSDVDALPQDEMDALASDGDRIFDAYVNIGSIGTDELRRLAVLYPSAKFISTTGYSSDERVIAVSPETALDGPQRPDLFDAMIRQPRIASRTLVLSNAGNEKWRQLSDFLGSDHPSHPFPTIDDVGQRHIDRYRGPVSAARDSDRKKWDALPWIVVRADWAGIAPRPSADSGEMAVTEYDDFRFLDDSIWTARDDTFPSNQALFRPANVEPGGHGGCNLTFRREDVGVRTFTSGALSSVVQFSYGRFGAVLRPARGSGLITGVFLHRNAPRQEIDIELLGRDTTKMLTNVYFNPGCEGTRLEYGYRGTPVEVDLGFDAADALHRYEIEWTPWCVRWLVDDQVLHERRHWAPTPIPDLPMQFHVNLWHSRSRSLAGRLDRRQLPARTHVRSVMVSVSTRTQERALPQVDPVNG